MGQYGETIRIGTLATFARAEDRPAFDYLVQVSLGNKPESANPELRRLADETAGAIIAEKRLGPHLGINFTQPQTPDTMKKFMASADPGEREAALDNYPQGDKSILPILVQMIRGDGNVTVLYMAVGRFNSLTGQAFGFWKESELLSWWDKNQSLLQGGAGLPPK